MTLDEVFDYLGPKPAECCYSFVFDKIEDGYFHSVKQVRDFLRKIIKHDKSMEERLWYRPSFFDYNEVWIEQAKEIFLFIEEKK